MAISLAENGYGKSSIRLVKVERGAERHELRDLTVDVRFEGDFAAAHVEGDNRLILPTDTMKNTVYALAARGPLYEIEGFGLALGRHFLAGNPQVRRVQVRLAEHLWERVAVDGAPHPHAFVRAGDETRRAEVVLDRAGSVDERAEVVLDRAGSADEAAAGETQATVEAGLDGLVLLKTAGSAFTDFRRDALTTLRETSDRILATAVDATWRYRGEGAEHGACWRGVRDLLIATFAAHESLSLQHTLYAMGEAVLAAWPGIDRIHLSLPNRHHLPVDLVPFGLENRNEVFVATTEPYGLIEATLSRS